MAKGDILREGMGFVFIESTKRGQRSKLNRKATAFTNKMQTYLYRTSWAIGFATGDIEK